MDHSGDIKTATPDAVTVSAAPKYNVDVKRASDQYISTISNYDFSTGNDKAQDKTAGRVYGKLQAYGMSLQLRGENKIKGLKGIELPKGPISFTVDFSAAYRDEKGVSHPVAKPLVWTFDDEQYRSNKPDGREVESYTRYTFAAVTQPRNGHNPLPLRASPKTGTIDTWNGGSWSIEPLTDGKFKITVKDYVINPFWFPNTNLGTSNITSPTYFNPETGVQDVGIFSTGSVYVVVPFGAGSKDSPDYYPNKYGKGSLRTTVAIADFAATGLSGQAVTNTAQINKNDDRVDATVPMSVVGSYRNAVKYSGGNRNSSVVSDVNNIPNGIGYLTGEDALPLGGNFSIRFGGTNSPFGDGTQALHAANFLMKFDNKGMDIDQSTPPTRTGDSYLRNLDSTILYAAKPDGSGWSSDDEINAAREENLVYYKSLDELRAAGKVNVGVLVEYRLKQPKVDKFSAQQVHNTVWMKAKTDPALAGKTYMVTEVTNLWRQDKYEAVLRAHGGKFPSRADMQPGQSLTADPATRPEVYNNTDGTPYVKGAYDASGYRPGSGQEPYKGDTLLLVAYASSVTKRIAQLDDSGQAKKIYDLDANQFTVDYEIRPSMDVKEGVAWTTPTTMIITDTLPRGMAYEPGSSHYGGTYKLSAKPGRQGQVAGGESLEPHITMNQDGTTTLTWVIADVPVKKVLPSIFFSAKMDGATKANVQFVNKVSIATTEDMRSPHIQNGNLSEVAHSTSRTSDIAVLKASDQAAYDPGRPIKYTMSYINNGGREEPAPVMMDTLPQNGDAAGSRFAGTYKVSGVKVVPPAGQSMTAYQVWYTTDANVKDKISVDYTDAGIKSGSENGTTWRQLQLAADGQVALPAETPTAIVLLGSLPSKKTAELHIELAPQGNTAGDRYVNSASIGGATITRTTPVLKRVLSGTAWHDKNVNGKRDGDEAKLAGVTVTVYDDQGAIATDVNGRQLQTKTNQDGLYKFENLRAGNFKVVFTSGDVTLGDYKVTQKAAAGVDVDHNSDAAPALGDKAEGAAIDGVVMPADQAVLNSVHHVRSMDIGLYRLYKKTHEFQSGTAGKDLPQKVKDLLPASEVNLRDGQAVTPSQPAVSKVPVDDGKWVFEGYAKQTEVVQSSDVNFVGKWVFVGEVAPTKAVKNDKGDVIDAQKAKAGDVLTYVVKYTNKTGEVRTVTIADAVPAHTTYVKDSASLGGVLQGDRMVWTMQNVADDAEVEVSFKVMVNDGVNGVTIENTATVNNGAKDITTNTTTNPVDKLYKKTHEFKSGTAGKELPDDVKDLLPPPVAGAKHGDALMPDQPAKTRVNVPGGAWVFKGYDKQSQTVDNADVQFVGEWVFEPAAPAQPHKPTSTTPPKNIAAVLAETGEANHVAIIGVVMLLGGAAVSMIRRAS